MVSFIDFHFRFLANFQTSTLPHMFSIFTHVMKPVRDTNCKPGLPVVLREMMSEQLLHKFHTDDASLP